MLQSKKVAFSHISLHIGQNDNNNPLYVVVKKFELLQHVVAHYKKSTIQSQIGQK